MQRVLAVRQHLQRAGPAITVAAFVAFVLIMLVAISRFPWDTIDDPRPNWLVAAVALAPLTLWLNAEEFRLQGRLVEARIGSAEAWRVTVLGSAANLAPIPGSALVRLAALTSATSTVRAGSSTIAIGLSWLGWSGVLAGLGLITVGATAGGALCLGLGAGAVSASTVVIHRFGSGTLELASRLSAIEIGSVLVGALRLLAVGRGIGLDIDSGQAAALVIGGALATASGIVPAGLGVRELLTEALGRLSGLEPAAGVLIAGFDRIVGLAVLALAAVVVVSRRRTSTA